MTFMNVFAILLIGLNVCLSIYFGLNGNAGSSAIAGGGAVVSTLFLLGGAQS